MLMKTLTCPSSQKQDLCMFYTWDHWWQRRRWTEPMTPPTLITFPRHVRIRTRQSWVILSLTPPFFFLELELSEFLSVFKNAEKWRIDKILGWLMYSESNTSNLPVEFGTFVSVLKLYLRIVTISTRAAFGTNSTGLSPNGYYYVGPAVSRIAAPLTMPNGRILLYDYCWGVVWVHFLVPCY